MKQTLKSGILGGVMGCIVSFGVNYFLLPAPETIMENAAGNGVSGLASGFMGGFMGLLIHLKSAVK